MVDQESLLQPGEKKRRWCGCPDCLTWAAWRADGTNRFLWKSFCSGCLIAEFSVYFYLVLGQPWLFAIGALSLVKFLTETWGQDTPTWVCPGGPVMFFIMYVLILPNVVYFGGVCTTNADINFPHRGPVGFALFVFGSCFSLSYELHRFQWKKNPENKGKLHTIQLAKYCIHPNYFGDLFTYSGWAICTGTTCFLTMPVMMIWTFVFFVNPNSDAYLASKYSEQWPQYVAKTATLVPFLHSKLGNQLFGLAALVLSVYLSTSCPNQCG